MNHTTADQQLTVINYLDDTLLASNTVQGMLNLIDAVLTRFEEVGLTIKVTKSEFMCQKVQMLGHIVTPESIEPAPGKVKAVKDFPPITTLKQLRSFIGLAAYYRGFIKDFSQAAGPLIELTKKGKTKFKMTPETLVA